MPAAAIGWDWEMGFVEKCIQLRRVSEPRSNLMTLNAKQKDVGCERSILLQKCSLMPLSGRL